MTEPTNSVKQDVEYTKVETSVGGFDNTEWGLDYTWAQLNMDYCYSPAAIIRMAEMVVCLVIVSCISSVFGTGPFIGLLFGHTFALVLSSLCLCVTFMFLLLIFLGLHKTHLYPCPWRYVDLVYSALVSFSFLVCAILEAYYSTGHWHDCQSEKKCPIYYEWMAASAFCFVNTILYAMSACLALQKGFYK